jgi:Rrf2 family protein
MSSNSRFTVATHILTLLASTDEPVSSDEIAVSVNTNPVVIRRLLSEMAKAGLVQTQQGSGGGSRLSRSADSISLADIYRAMEPGSLFGMHRHAPNPTCEIGSNIQSVMGTVFDQADQAVVGIFGQISLAQILQSVRAAAAERV